jgi:hypothetical protein
MPDEPVDPRTVEITGTAHVTIDVFDFLRERASPPETPAEAATDGE